MGKQKHLRIKKQKEKIDSFMCLEINLTYICHLKGFFVKDERNKRSSGDITNQRSTQISESISE